MSSSRSPAASKRSHESRARRRNLLVGGLLGLWMMALVVRLYCFQVVQYVSFVARAQRQQQRTIEVAPKRGTIFDRHMHPLAMSMEVDSVYAAPTEISNPQMVADLLGPILGLAAGDIVGRFKAYRSFCWLKRKVSSEEATRVRELNLKGVYFQKEMKRVYPKGRLAAHVLGTVGLDDNGLAGLEYSLNGVIQGRPGRVLAAEDARGQTFRSTEWEGQPGRDVVLTLDENIQYTVERALDAAMASWRPAWGTIVVQDPYTGEILAMAGEPTFNPNEFAKSDPQARVNKALSMVYEPGSTFKIVTVSAALEERLTSREEVIDCQAGAIVLAGHVIHDHRPFGALTLQQVIAKSSDVGAIKLGLRLGQKRLDRYIRFFGFGSRTEIELPGEERGLLKSPAHWSGISIGSISMGQEVGVTPLQLVSAYSAIANGGVLLQPRLVREVLEGESRDTLPPVHGHRVVSAHTAGLMKQMFQEAVISGTGAPAQLTGYSTAGKTGTAQKVDKSGRYSKSHFVSSFVGFAPVEQPAVTILVVIDSPAGAIHGGEVAAPVFRSVAEQTLGYLEVPHDNPSYWLQVASRAPAGPVQQGRAGRTGIHPAGLEPPEAATPSVRNVSFSSSSSPAVHGTVVVDGGPLLTVPDFTSLAVRQVAEECERLGLELDLVGSGLAVEQNPRPGSKVPAGALLWVRFTR